MPKPIGVQKPNNKTHSVAVRTMARIPPNAPETLCQLALLKGICL